MSFAAERKRKGLSQEEVGAALGVSGPAVCMWETGKTVPRMPMLKKLATLYGCTVDDLLRESDANATEQPSS